MLELTDIEISNDAIIYDIRILSGSPPPADFTDTSLFIDCYGLILVCDTN